MSVHTGNSRAVAGILAVLTCGVVLGILLDRTILDPSSATAVSGEYGSALTSLIEHVDLRPDQIPAIDAVLQRHHGAVTGTWEAMRPRLDSAIDDVGADIEVLLDEDQLREFREWVRRAHGRNGGTHDLPPGSH